MARRAGTLIGCGKDEGQDAFRFITVILRWILMFGLFVVNLDLETLEIVLGFFGGN